MRMKVHENEDLICLVFIVTLLRTKNKSTINSKYLLSKYMNKTVYCSERGEHLGCVLGDLKQRENLEL